MGLLTFAFTITHKTHWIGPAVGNGMQAFGLTAVSNIAVTYAVDCYQPVCTHTDHWNMLNMLISKYKARWRVTSDGLYHSKHNRRASLSFQFKVAPSAEHFAGTYSLCRFCLFLISLQVFSEMIGVQYFFLLLSIPLYFSTSKILKLTVNYGPMRRQVALANGGSPNV